MPMFDVAGLPGGPIELPVNLIINLLPSSQEHRPGLQREMPGFWVQHETDNHHLGAGARMHRNFLFDGAPDNNGNEQFLSYHFAVDDHEIYQMVPIDEVTWHATDGFNGPGNRSGISCEMCVNDDGNKNLTRLNTVALARAICNRLGLHADRVKRHFDFNAADPDRHHCPDVMMNEGFWPTFVERVAGGPQTIPTPFLFPQVRVFHVPAGVNATAREAPDQGSPVVIQFEPGTAISIDGFYVGEDVRGEARWLRTSGPQHLAIHKSGLSEPI